MNNNFIRSGNNNNRNRNNNNRNRNNANNNNRRHGSGGGGGNPSNKVHDSNGPDVKLRGTPQTIAEKYMQMGRDAQSAGDSVAAENYYQHAEHYYRLWAASQPVGQSLQMSRKYGEEEFDENGDYIVEEEGENAPADGNIAAPAEGGEAQGEGQQADQPQGEGQQQRPPRNNNNNRDQNNNNRDPNSRERFKPRWQNKRERFSEQPREGGGEGQAPQASSEEASAAAPAPAQPSGGPEGQWEAPSFLQRPTPIVEAAEPAAEEEAAPKRARTRKPRAEASEDVVSGLAEDAPPQGE
ncbi:MAG: DUF4167 domain-containing protein [Aestuariivirga sp.]